MRGAWLFVVAMGCTKPHVATPLAEVPTNRGVDIVGYTTTDGVHRACDGTATFDAPLERVSLQCDGETSSRLKAELQSLDVVASGRSTGDVIFYSVLAGAAAIILGALIVLSTTRVSGG